ncbi:type II toxin-antitoxin system PemK/MazF family toxin [bacterium]|nr:type II toxin-antitoxin system PemK/MazF family toxin [bacterium]
MTTNLSRGDIVRVRLSPVEGSEQAGERPALVLSPDVINKYSPVILVAAITSKKVDRDPFEVLITPPEGGLTHTSKILLMHIRSVDKRRLTGFYGRITDETMRKVEDALKIATGLVPI